MDALGKKEVFFQHEEDFFTKVSREEGCAEYTVLKAMKVAGNPEFQGCNNKSVPGQTMTVFFEFSTACQKR
jgi:hypothetical protein